MKFYKFKLSIDFQTWRNFLTLTNNSKWYLTLCYFSVSVNTIYLTLFFLLNLIMYKLLADCQKMLYMIYISQMTRISLSLDSTQSSSKLFIIDIYRRLHRRTLSLLHVPLFLDTLLSTYSTYLY